VGVVAGVVAVGWEPWQTAVLIGWDAAAAVFLLWMWLSVGRLDADESRALATLEDPSAPVVDTIILSAGVAALVGIGLNLVAASTKQGTTKAVLVGVGILTVVLSWICVHTIFTLLYARIYYGGEDSGGVDFNQDDPPTYLEFAYLSFTIGMTFQVSDTDLTSKPIRRVALGHALLSFAFGACIVALTVNVVGNLLK
jgi:uncharacterized membrane protein